MSRSEAEGLEIPFTEQEVREAIKECGGSKAPGPDGVNFKFIRRFWHIIREDLMKAVMWFYDKGEISRGCNASFVTLIPKVENPVGLSEFRPISLIGSYYKVLSKILAKRLKKVIGKLVDEVQNAFIEGRFILDGVLIANETVDFMRNKKEKCLIIKVDFEKAYDSLSWEYLDEVLSQMGFGDKWRKWMRVCLKSASISLLANGSPTEEFKMERGVRQGDPLSPFLFILAAEGLNAMIKEAKQSGLFRGVQVGMDRVEVSHLQYADDSIFFGEWDRRNIGNLMIILKSFEAVSGLKINLNKSRFYGLGVRGSEVEVMAKYLKCRVGEIPFTYLGLPIGKSMRREGDWRVVVEKFKKRLSDWKARSMSFGGRLTLIKSVLGSLALYYLSIFRSFMLRNVC